MSRGMTVDDAFDAPEVFYPRRDVLRILRDHGVETVCTTTATFFVDGVHTDDPDSTFLAEFGDHESYSLAAVLAWLGY